LSEAECNDFGVRAGQPGLKHQVHTGGHNGSVGGINDESREWAAGAFNNVALREVSGRRYRRRLPVAHQPRRLVGMTMIDERPNISDRAGSSGHRTI
jgi:hypothetical protein